MAIHLPPPPPLLMALPFRNNFLNDLEVFIFFFGKEVLIVVFSNVDSGDGGMYQCLAVNEDEESQAGAQMVLGIHIYRGNH